MNTRTRRSLVGVLCVLLLPTQALAQSTLWERYNDAGAEAYEQGRYTEAEKQFIAAHEEAKKFGPEDPRLAMIFSNLAALYRAQGQYAKAEPLYQRAVAIMEKALGTDHPNVATSLENYAELLRNMNRETEAARMEALAETIRAKHAEENPTK